VQRRSAWRRPRRGRRSGLRSAPRAAVELSELGHRRYEAATHRYLGTVALEEGNLDAAFFQGNHYSTDGNPFVISSGGVLYGSVEAWRTATNQELGG